MNSAKIMSKDRAEFTERLRIFVDNERKNFPLNIGDLEKKELSGEELFIKKKCDYLVQWIKNRGELLFGD